MLGDLIANLDRPDVARSLIYRNPTQSRSPIESTFEPIDKLT
jgi:hypothetical protein